MTHEEYLLTIQVTPSLEEAVIDCLLSLNNHKSFSSYPLYAHDYGNQVLSTEEQVRGRQKKISLVVYLEKKALAVLLTQLKTEFANAGLKYWVTPVVESGVI